MDETIRKTGDGQIAVDTPKVETVSYDVTFLTKQKARLETELAEVNAILAKAELVKDEVINPEPVKIEDLLKADVVDVKVIK